MAEQSTGENIPMKENSSTNEIQNSTSLKGSNRRVTLPYESDDHLYHPDCECDYCDH